MCAALDRFVCWELSGLSGVIDWGFAVKSRPAKTKTLIKSRRVALMLWTQ